MTWYLAYEMIRMLYKSASTITYHWYIHVLSFITLIGFFAFFSLDNPRRAPVLLLFSPPILEFLYRCILRFNYETISYRLPVVIFFIKWILRKVWWICAVVFVMSPPWSKELFLGKLWFALLVTAKLLVESSELHSHHIALDILRAVRLSELAESVMEDFIKTLQEHGLTRLQVAYIKDNKLFIESYKDELVPLTVVSCREIQHVNDTLISLLQVEPLAKCVQDYNNDHRVFLEKSYHHYISPDPVALLPLLRLELREKYPDAQDYVVLKTSNCFYLVEIPNSVMRDLDLKHLGCALTIHREKRRYPANTAEWIDWMRLKNREYHELLEWSAVQHNDLTIEKE